jgi:hypothetical protein
MNLLFADVDGVFNRFGPAFSESLSDYNPQFEPECVRAFNRIVRETEARLVISSSWRYLMHNGHLSLYGFQVLLRSHGVRGEVIGYTREDLEDEPRWRQIADWMRRPNNPDGAVSKLSGRGFEHYCILDDDPDAFGGRYGVLTKGAVGLTEADADLAIEILRGLKRTPANHKHDMEPT